MTTLRRVAAGGRFNIRQNHDINVTPFIDVMLVLLIVFIIAAPLATTAIKVDLAAGNGQGPSRTLISILIDDRGRILLRSASHAEVATNLDSLGRDLAKAVGPGRRADIVVSGAAHTRYGAFMSVIDRLHTDGFTSVMLADKTA